MTTQALETTQQPVIDIGLLAEEGIWSTPRKQVLLLCALAIILDGLDNQILGFAIPSMIKEWSVTRGDFAPALALGFVGMTVGGQAIVTSTIVSLKQAPSARSARSASSAIRP